MNGIRLCCGFSRVTNQRKYCGPKEAYKQMADFLRTEKGQDEVSSLLSQFEGLYPYLQLIAQKHGLSPFDDGVIEAYWLGNELLDAFSSEDYLAFFPELVKKGLPRQFVANLERCMPLGAIPHHTFHVLFIGVGRVTGSVPTNLASMKQCMATWGEVLHVGSSDLLVKGPLLQQQNSKFSLSSHVEYTVSYEPSLFQPKEKDMVAMHWGECACILNIQQYENLKYYTQKVIALVNSSL